jgi:hypothetical protein
VVARHVESVRASSGPDRADISDFHQAAFVRALLDPDLPPPDALSTRHAGSVRLFDVHRNNVIGGLVDALCDRFPVCLRLVGDEFFRAMTQTYVRSSLPRTPILYTYGEDFADFVASFEPASGLPYLPDVARLEYAAGRAYHAVDAAPLSLAAFRSLPSHRLATATVLLHPSAHVVRSAYPIVSIWRQNASDNPPDTVVLDHGEDALIVRPRFEVEIRVLPPGGATFVEILMRGGAFGEAARYVLRQVKDFNLTGCLTTLLACEAFSAIDVQAPGGQASEIALLGTPKEAGRE